MQENIDRHLFVFGYETPKMVEYNTKLGTDDENSERVFIRATSEEMAFNLGKEMASEFLSCLYKDTVWNRSVNDYAHWIEDNPGDLFDDRVMASIPEVTIDDPVAISRVIQTWLNEAET